MCKEKDEENNNGLLILCTIILMIGCIHYGMTAKTLKQTMVVLNLGVGVVFNYL